MLISKNLHAKSSDVSIKTRSTPASLSFIGQVTKHTTVRWPFANEAKNANRFPFPGSRPSWKERCSFVSPGTPLTLPALSCSSYLAHVG